MFTKPQNEQVEWIANFEAWYTLDRNPPASLEGIKLIVPASTSTSLQHP